MDITLNDDTMMKGAIIVIAITILIIAKKETGWTGTLLLITALTMLYLLYRIGRQQHIIPNTNQILTNMKNNRQKQRLRQPRIKPQQEKGIKW